MAKRKQKLEPAAGQVRFHELPVGRYFTWDLEPGRVLAKAGPGSYQYAPPPHGGRISPGAFVTPATAGGHTSVIAADLDRQAKALGLKRWVTATDTTA